MALHPPEACGMDKPGFYRIRVQGILPDGWIDRLGGMQIIAVSWTLTTLEGWLPDQAALKGVLDTLYELRLGLEGENFRRGKQQHVPPYGRTPGRFRSEGEPCRPNSWNRLDELA